MTKITTKTFLEIISSKYELKSLDVGEFVKMKISGMNFNIAAYKAMGLGHVSVMNANGFLGLMKMDTLIIVPENKDLPLYSYDRILAMGNDTLIIELYDTMAGHFNAAPLDKIKSQFTNIPDNFTGKHWYDDIKLPQSISKKAKRTPELNTLAIEYLKAFLSSNTSEILDTEQTDIKRQKTEHYVFGLLENGGPSTDVFKKKIGEKRTTDLFHKVLFGTAL